MFLAADRAGDRVVVVGERGFIRVSDDRGVSWRPARSPVDVTLTAVRFANERTGWAVGHEGVILKTMDGGETWILVHGHPDAPAPASHDRSFFSERAPLFDLLVLDELRVWTVGAYGVALRSKDAGDTWAPVIIDRRNDFHFYALARDAGGTLWAAGEAGVLFASRDGGREWVPQTKLTPGSFFGATPLDGGGLLLYGLRGRAFVRRTEGDSWRVLPGLPPRSLHGAARVAPNTVLIGGAGGHLVFYDDRRGTTTNRRLPVTRDIHCLLPLDADRVLVFSDGETKAYALADLRGETRP